MSATIHDDGRVTVPTTADMLAAIESSDGRFDGRFWYGVVTTGVYCRPSCPSRSPKRDNVRVFQDPDAAEAAGFRACKRCRPQSALRDVDSLVAVARYIEAHADERLTLGILASRAGLSPARLQKKFRRTFGASPKEYQDALRQGRFREALKVGETVTDAIYAAGYGSPSRVYGEAARHLGMTPSAYRAGGEGETIWYACRGSALGPLMLAATTRGVCFAQFGDSEAALVEALQREFPRARLETSSARDGSELDAWLAALDAHVSDNAPRPDVPLDLRGTALQLRVWRFLLSVREGEVLSYAELARGIGRPKAARAVASACARNRIGVLVPCHRVLRGDGTLGGYRWGLERKRTLLDAERRRSAS